MSNIATESELNLKLALQSIAELGNGKVMSILSEDDLMNKAKLVPFPAAGLVYEGMRSRAEVQVTQKVGLSVDLGISIVVFYRPDFPAGTDMKNEALMLLDKIRNKIKGTTAPGGKKWRFVAEVPAVEKAGVVVWIQRWSTPVMLTEGL